MAGEWEFSTRVEVEYSTDRFEEDCEYDSEAEVYIKWEAYFDVRNWGIKGLSFSNRQDSINFTIDVEVLTGELDKYGDPAFRVERKDIQVSLKDANVETTRGWGLSPYKIKVDEVAGKQDVTIFVSMPCGGPDD